MNWSFETIHQEIMDRKLPDKVKDESVGGYVICCPLVLFFRIPVNNGNAITRGIREEISTTKFHRTANFKATGNYIRMANDILWFVLRYLSRVVVFLITLSGDGTTKNLCCSGSSSNDCFLYDM